jgi:alkylation response protein AidB-like acyl-CoA dehydrogenase
MSTALHYKANLRDIEFNLFEYLNIQSTALGKKPFGALDEETARQTLKTMLPVCRDEFAKGFVEGDQTPLILDKKSGTVTTPPSMRESYRMYFEQGFHQLELPAHLGGMGAPPSLRWGAFEMLVGAHASLAFYFLGNTLAKIIDALATDSQKARFVKPLIERHWGGTMVLTEPDAGSDVGAGRTKAKHLRDDVYEIEGVKRFITSGDFDGVDNIVHLVLARPEGAGPGTKGLSMFIVPKFHVNDDGSLGARNGAFCTNLEKKMGLKASATCEMTFGDGVPAVGYLVGNVHDGIRQMFHVIEHARMAIGVKGMATLSTAYLNALAFAKDRKQGADLMQSRDKNAPRASILQHPDVRRMLMLQKSHAEGMRALVLHNAAIQDAVEIQGGHLSEMSAENSAMNDLLLPLIKGFCSEKAYELMSLSLQTFGGSGYLSDYPIEQYLRDAKIDTLYEGTTHIQALDLLMRKIAKDGGATLQRLLEQVGQTISTNEGGASLAEERTLLAKALADMQQAFGLLMEKLGESVYHVGLLGNRMLMSLAELVIGWLLLRHGALALEKKGSASGDEAMFYEGKIASARFFAREVLPGISLTKNMVKNSTLGIMNIPLEAF